MSGLRSVGIRWAAALAAAVGLCAPAGAQSAAKPPEAVPLPLLLADHPSPTFRKLERPVSIDFLLAGLRARDAKLKSATASTELRTWDLGPFADAGPAKFGQPAGTRKRGEDMWQTVRCDWTLSGRRVAYRTTAIQGNTMEAQQFDRRAAAFDGREYRQVERYRADGIVQAHRAPHPGGMMGFYDLDPRAACGEWRGHLSTLRGEIQRLRTTKGVAERVGGTEVVSGAVCYRLELRWSNGDRWYLWLDRDHDLIVRREESIDHDYRLVGISEAPELVSSGGVWMASERRFDDYLRAIKGQYLRKMSRTMVVTDWEANVPVVDSTFSLPFEPGAYVDDQVKGTQYRIAAPPARKGAEPRSDAPRVAGVAIACVVLSATLSRAMTPRSRKR